MTENEKMMKKQLLLLMMMLSMAISAFAAEEVEISGLWYQVITKGKVAKVIKYKNYVQYSGDVIIPSTVEYNGVTCDVTTIVSEAFLNCGNLTSVTIGNSVTRIQPSAFENCIRLTSIMIPNSVTNIGETAFANCTDLVTITIGNGVETIYSKAFANCPELTDVYCYATNIPIMKTIDKACTDAFEGSYIDYATLHVPAASVNAYSTTAPWSGFGTITGLDSPETPKCAKPTIQVVDGKLQFSCETEGVEFCYDIKNIDAASGTGSEIQMPTSTEYLITVYAKKDGYMNSEEASMSLVRSAGLKGDANNDGEVDIADAVHIVNFIVGKINNLAPRKDSNQRTAE